MSALPNSGGVPLSSLRLAVKKFAGRLQDWFVIQSLPRKLVVVTLVVMIPATALYSFALLHRETLVAAQLRAMTVAAAPGEGVWRFNERLPVVFGTGSLLGFLKSPRIERITVVYEPLTENTAEHIVLVESQGRHYAYYP